jgi:hypothetical protein
MQPISIDQLRFTANQESVEASGEPSAPPRTIERLQLELWVDELETHRPDLTGESEEWPRNGFFA